MLVPLSWLRDFAPIDAPISAIAEALDQLGLEVEGVRDPGAGISGVVVARVLDVVEHPNADKLRLCDVDYGAGTTRVVCGAPNVYVGMIAPLAREGATLPALGEDKLTKRKIRGIESDGMLCSAAELALDDDHSGIVDLGEGLEPGVDVREALGLDDTVFDLSITPNRPDAMSVVGVARELAAHFALPFEPTVVRPGPVADAIADVTVVVEAVARCPRISVRRATVAMGESPEWIKRRLRLAGMRPISNVVDVTNYVMLERGRPLHAFDLAKLDGRGLLVRLAQAGETMTTLDGVVRELTVDDLLICDAAGVPHAIAGVMGGGRSEVSDDTTEILIESAYFESSGIAKTSKRLNLRSEASARFERGVDPEATVAGADLAVSLLEQVAGAQAQPETIDVYPEPVEPVRISVRTERVNTILGTEIDSSTMRGLLEPLGIEIMPDDGDFTALAPTWRPDLEREIDIIEEVGRRHGLDRIARTVPTSRGRVGHLSAHQSERRIVIDTMVGAGCSEVYTLSLLSPAQLERSRHETDGLVVVENPLRAEESILRPAILPGLLTGVATNAGQGNLDVAIFESGVVFGSPNSSDGRGPRDRNLPYEQDHVAAVRAGFVRRAPHEADRPVDVYDAVALVEALRDALRLADLTISVDEVAGFHPTRGARVRIDGDAAGAVGEIHPDALTAHGLAGPVVGMELDVNRLLAGRRRSERGHEVSRYPASNIDLAFVVDENVPAADVLATLRDAGGPVLEQVRLFDVFRSESLGASRKSLAFALRFRATDRTLNDQQVGGLRKKCVKAVEKAHSAELRA